MNKTKTILILVAITAILAIIFWQKTLQPTTIEIKDPVRHYFPIVQGDELLINCQLTNTGDEDLAITSIQPSNFTISMISDMPGIIPAGKTETLTFVFHSEKNIGFTSHVIRFYGNIYGCEYDSLVFDTHIVRPTVDGSDYEEIYYKQKSDMEVLVDGERGQKNYWTDDNIDDIDSSYIHNYNNVMHTEW